MRQRMAVISDLDRRLGAELGWQPATPLAELGPVRSFVSADSVGDRLVVRYFVRDHDRALVGKAWFGPAAEGPPGHAHGGSMAAVLDEALGAAAWMAGYPVLARTLTTEFVSMLPIGQVVVFEARIIAIEAGIVRIEGRISSIEGKPFATAEGVYVKLSPERLRALRSRSYAANLPVSPTDQSR